MDDSALIKSACGRYEIWLHEEVQSNHLLSGPIGIQIVDKRTHEDILTLSNQDWHVSSPKTTADGFLNLQVFLVGTTRLGLTLDLDARRFCIAENPDVITPPHESCWNSDWGRLPETLAASARAHAVSSPAFPAAATRAAAVAPSEVAATPPVDVATLELRMKADNAPRRANEREAELASRREATSHGVRAIGNATSKFAEMVGVILKWGALAIVATIGCMFVIVLFSS